MVARYQNVQIDKVPPRLRPVSLNEPCLARHRITSLWRSESCHSPPHTPIPSHARKRESRGTLFGLFTLPPWVPAFAGTNGCLSWRQEPEVSTHVKDHPVRSRRPAACIR